MAKYSVVTNNNNTVNNGKKIVKNVSTQATNAFFTEINTEKHYNNDNKMVKLADDGDDMNSNFKDLFSDLNEGQTLNSLPFRDNENFFFSEQFNNNNLLFKVNIL
jgi:hypothetical protein